MTDHPARPGTADRFRYEGYEIDPAAGRLTCRYSAGGEQFVERVTLEAGPGWATPAAGAAARLVFLLAGVSYYKTAVPPVVDLGDLATTPAERAFLHTFYLEGLAELAYRNGLDLSGLRLEGPDLDRRPSTFHRPVPLAPSPGRPLVPFGGGIDSIVTVEAVRAGHPDTTLFVAGRGGGDRFEAIERPAGVTGLPVRRAGREIDPKVLRSAERGYVNGHVPVTGILSAVAVLAAVVHGHGAVVMSNEWSASSGTVEVGGRTVNHQWSKGFQFEQGFRALLAATFDPPPDYFSLLRPWSELWVARRFAGLPRYHPAFRSCNRAFHLDPARRLDRWCGTCDKCCFIDLILAPYMDEAALAAVFGGREPLADPSLADRFRSLLGTGPGGKPFECVGDQGECRAALRLAAARPDRAATPLLRTLATELGPVPAPGEPSPDDLLRPMGPHHVPDGYVVSPARGPAAPSGGGKLLRGPGTPPPGPAAAVGPTRGSNPTPAVRPRLRWSDLRGAAIGVWGLGVEGRATLRRLRTLGVAAPVLVDDHPPADSTGGAAEVDGLPVLATDRGGLEALARCEVVVKSPGISRSRDDVGTLVAAGIPVTGGLGLWLEEVDRDRVVCVTGTKGKSTTAAIAGHLLDRLDYRCLVAGNIGRPPFDPEAGDGYDLWVVEVSSFQATDLSCSPPVVAVTSLHPDHLDWHGTVDAYYRDKLSACSQPGAKLTVADGDSELLRSLRPQLGPEVRWVSAGDHELDGPWVDALGLLGAHNRRNALIARACLAALGVPAAGGGPDGDEALARAAAGFRGLDSRLRPVATVDGVTFVDDSLSTNVLPTLAALDAFPGRRLALLVGGFDRGIDYRPLAEAVAARPAPTLVLTLPDSGPRIRATVEAALERAVPGTVAGGADLGGTPAGTDGTPVGGVTGRAGESRPTTEVHDCPDLASATEVAYRWARPDGVVLLSPAAPSFGRFRDYRDRAAAFADAARSCTSSS